MFERRIGVYNGFVNQVTDRTGMDKFGKIFSEFPNLNSNWLLTGEGEMLNPTYNATNNGTIIGGNNLNVVNNKTNMPDGFPQFNKWFPVYGDSMSPTFNAGDSLALSACTSILNGRYYVVETKNNGSFACKLHYDEQYTATYDNIPTTDTILADEVIRIYQVVGVLRRIV